MRLNAVWKWWSWVGLVHCGSLYHWDCIGHWGLQQWWWFWCGQEWWLWREFWLCRRGWSPCRSKLRFAKKGQFLICIARLIILIFSIIILAWHNVVIILRILSSARNATKGSYLNTRNNSIIMIVNYKSLERVTSLPKMLAGMSKQLNIESNSCW